MTNKDERSKLVSPPTEQFKQRESKELILAFSGPVGSGINAVIDKTKEILGDIGYSIKYLKLSDDIIHLFKSITNDPTKPDIDIDNILKKDRYKTLQSAGNFIRIKYEEPDILAQYTIWNISNDRAKQELDKEGIDGVSNILPRRRVYIIDQLKHPEEVILLRTVYGNIFYLIGVLCSHEQRKKRLEADGLDPSDAEEVMEKDRKDEIEHGQQLDKTLKLADYFVRNSHSNLKNISYNLKRFYDLIHGKNGITPTKHEFNMYVAHAASLKSACLSRQVGASIADADGNILTTGCNDAPKGGGGLYSESDKERDHRCVFKGGQCHNDFHKHKLEEEIGDIIVQELTERDEKSSSSPATPIVSGYVISDNNKIRNIASHIAQKVKKTTRLRDLLEFSRSIHAEMDALISIARQGGTSVIGCYLYTTTFPCHICARHIIAAGISKVFYIEPYEKSLALELHDDAIIIDSEEEDTKENKIVQFLHFEGVSPRQFNNLFYSQEDRKGGDGKVINKSVITSDKIIPQYLDSYIDFEAKVVAHLNKHNIPLIK